MLSAVGCVSRAVLRDAGGVNLRSVDEPCEIVSLNGTASRTRCHLHLALSREDLSVIGGHMMPGCIVNTTCELVLGVLEHMRFDVEQDAQTGYDELIFTELEAMKNTTLCYIERDGCYLLLHRVKKKNDLNHNKWVGIGGKFEETESPEECLLRETREETGLTLTSWRYCGIVTFVSDRWEGEYMHLFHADGFEGELIDCNEGVLEWIPKERFHSLPQWEG